MICKMDNKKILKMAACVAGVMVLTSCLKGGDNTQSGGAFGVIDILPSDIVPVAYIDDATPIYSPEFSKYTPGKTVAFSYTINYNAPENTAGKKYFTAVVPKVEEVPQVYASAQLSDTTTLYKNEFTISGAKLAWNMVKNHAFVQTAHPVLAKTQINRFEMSFDVTRPDTIDNQRVYGLVIRAVKESGAGAESEGGIVTAFNLSTFLGLTLQREKSEGNTDVKFRFKYIKEFNKDTTAATWGASDIISYPIAMAK